MKNITVSVDEETYRLSRVKAAEAGTSVPALVRAYLVELVQGRIAETQFDRLRRLQDETLESIRSRGGGLNSADTRHHGPVTKRGNQEVRWIVSQWAVRLLTRNVEVRQWARSRLRRMHMNKVRITLARRLVVGLYVSRNRGEAFSLTRCLASA